MDVSSSVIYVILYPYYKTNQRTRDENLQKTHLLSSTRSVVKKYEKDHWYNQIYTAKTPIPGQENSKKKTKSATTDVHMEKNPV